MVIDTHILRESLTEAPEDSIVGLVASRKIAALISDKIRYEYDRILQREREGSMEAKLRLYSALRAMHGIPDVVPTRRVQDLVIDRSDWPFVAATLQYGAVLITSDWPHILSVEKELAEVGVEVMKPYDFAVRVGIVQPVVAGR